MACSVRLYSQLSSSCTALLQRWMLAASYTCDTWAWAWDKPCWNISWAEAGLSMQLKHASNGASSRFARQHETRCLSCLLLIHAQGAEELKALSRIAGRRASNWQKGRPGYCRQAIRMLGLRCSWYSGFVHCDAELDCMIHVVTTYHNTYTQMYS